MSDKRPTYDELSKFGQCVIDTHVADTKAVTNAANAPKANESPDDKERREKMDAYMKERHVFLRDLALEDRGIDSFLDHRMLVAACESNIPPNTPHATPRDLQKAARAKIVRT